MRRRLIHRDRHRPRNYTDQDARLVAAESRAKALWEQAEWLHAVVMKRDDQNHWQESVNQLFKGGSA